MKGFLSAKNGSYIKKLEKFISENNLDLKEVIKCEKMEESLVLNKDFSTTTISTDICDDIEIQNLNIEESSDFKEIDTK